MLTPIELPTLLFWENGNSWYGSKGMARFFIKPETPEGEDGEKNDTPEARMTNARNMVADLLGKKKEG